MNFNFTNATENDFGVTAAVVGVCEGTVAAGAAVEDTMSSEGWDG
jgi:hypothetical protein